MLFERLMSVCCKTVRDIKFGKDGKVVANWLREKPVLEFLRTTESYMRYEQINWWLMHDAHFEIHSSILAPFSKTLMKI